MGKHPSRDYFDYTCPDLDQIMETLASTLIEWIRNDEEITISDVKALVGEATGEIKRKVTEPGRTAFDDAVTELRGEIEDLEVKVWKLEKEYG